MSRSERILLPGPVGAIEVAIDHPDTPPVGLALIAHPHPLYGGTLDNKVAQTLARVMVELGYVAARPNFRGVGGSEGAHDDGNGETDDLLAVIHAMRARTGLADAPLAMAGFSFGSLVLSRVAKRVAVSRMVFVGAAVTRGHMENVPADTIVIHGEKDDTVPLDAVMRWAEPQELPVTVIPGADHFFHRRLHVIRAIIKAAWHA